MPLIPNPAEYPLFSPLNQAPGPLLDVWSGPASRAVLAGIRLNIFAALDQQPASADELAWRLGVDGRGLGLLLDTLAALGYLTRRGATFSLSGQARKWLTDSGALNCSSFYLFWGLVMDAFFPALEDSIRTGQPPLDFYQWIDSHPDASRHFQEGLLAVARYGKNLIVNSIPVPPTARSVLDVGGGHGMYAIALCQKHPQLTAVIFDSAAALVTGRKTIEAEGMGERVTVQEGNFLTDSLGAGYDLALVFNLVHGFSPAGNIEMLKQVRTALNPGGQVVILDQIVGVAPLPVMETISRVMGLSFFLLVGGQTYSFDAIREMLLAAGFGKVRLQSRFRLGNPLVLAEKGLTP
jgi:SAM-dependent methyltransferase